MYRSAYRAHVTDLLNSAFAPDRGIARLRTEYALVSPYVIGMNGETPGHTFLTSPAQFTDALSTLETYVRDRHAAALAALGVSR